MAEVANICIFSCKYLVIMSGSIMFGLLCGMCSCNKSLLFTWLTITWSFSGIKSLSYLIGHNSLEVGGSQGGDVLGFSEGQNIQDHVAMKYRILTGCKNPGPKVTS